jgi:hypothetical protein
MKLLSIPLLHPLSKAKCPSSIPRPVFFNVKFPQACLHVANIEVLGMYVQNLFTVGLEVL